MAHVTTTPTELLICRDCDTVHHRSPLGRSQSACCIECGATLARHQRLGFNERLALTLAAAILFAMANFTPILAIDFDGLQTHANVWSAVLSMQQGGIFWASLVLAATTFLVPMLQIALLLWLLTFSVMKRPVPGLVRALVALHWLRPWSMSEVFLLGALIVLVKLSNWVHIVPGPGMWALAALTVLLAILSKCDPASWWALTEPRES